MKRFKVYGRIIGSFSENEEFETKEEAIAKMNVWQGFMDEVEMVEL